MISLETPFFGLQNVVLLLKHRESFDAWTFYRNVEKLSEHARLTEALNKS